MIWALATRFAFARSGQLRSYGPDRGTRARQAEDSLRGLTTRGSRRSGDRSNLASHGCPGTKSPERESSESKADVEGGAERSLSTEPPDEDSQNGFHYLLVVVSPLWLRMQWKPEPYESTLLEVVAPILAVEG